MLNIISFCFVLTLPADHLDARVSEFRLPNGLLCITYVDSAAPVVSVGVYYRVGSYHEPPGKSGLSHMLEHMSFKRTDIYRPGDFDRILDSVGANNNGFTSTFYTGYYEKFSSDCWELGLRLEAARMSRCQLLDADFTSEHQVVAEERRLQDNRPNSVFRECLDAVVLLANPQRNPTIGWSDDIRRFTVEDVREWYRRHYNPANAILVVAGAVNPEDVKARVRRHFGPIRGRPVPVFDAYSLEPEQLGERRTVIRQRVSYPMLVVAFHSPGFRDSMYIVADLVAAILGRGRLSHLYRRLVTEEKLCTWAACWNSTKRDPGAIYIATQVKTVSDIPAVESIIAEEIARLRDSLATDYEMGRARNGIVAGMIFEREDASDIARSLAVYQITQEDWRVYQQYPVRLNDVTAEQVRAFARRYLLPDKRTVGILLPMNETPQQ